MKLQKGAATNSHSNMFNLQLYKTENCCRSGHVRCWNVFMQINHLNCSAVAIFHLRPLKPVFNEAILSKPLKQKSYRCVSGSACTPLTVDCDRHAHFHGSRV